MADEEGDVCAAPLRQVLDAIELWTDPNFTLINGLWYRSSTNRYYRSISMLDTSLAPNILMTRPEFPLYMGAVFGSFIAGPHPFLLEVVKWTPLTRSVGLKPADLQFLIFTDNFGANPGPPESIPKEDSIQLLYCVGRALEHLEACAVPHGNVSLSHIFVRRDDAGHLVAKLADISGRQEVNDFGDYHALYQQLLPGDPPFATLAEVVAHLRSLGGDLLSWHEAACRSFDQSAAASLVSAPYLSPRVLFALFSPDRRRKWPVIRDLLARASRTHLGGICAFVAVLFEFGIGVEVDGARAYEFYRRANDAGYPCADRLAALERPNDRDPQITGQVLALLGRPEEAADAFRRCTTPLGIAHFGQFLLGSPASESAGCELLTAAAARGCAFAHHALGLWHYAKANKEPANRLREWGAAFGSFREATKLGWPESAYLAGVLAVRLNKVGEDIAFFRIADEEFADPAAKAALKVLE
jgi:hypothetical protein